MYLNTDYHSLRHHPMHNNWNINYYWGYHWNQYDYNWFMSNRYPYFRSSKLMDYGTKPFVVNLNQAAKQINTFRTAIWTGKHFQVTLMSINVGDDIGLEVHPTTDQFIHIEAGQGLVQMG